MLGPTNTGKTHLAIERMLAHEMGIIGLPLRLLAREVYDKIIARIGPSAVALVTGEEKIKPPSPRFYVCTVEAMPLELEADFVAIDEIQLAADGERGHVFTDRLFHARGLSETLLLGAATMRDAIRDLLPGANLVSRPRLSKLAYAGDKKITRLPRRSAIVGFSANEVYAIAELVRRQRGGAAVVLGALSPRTRNAQVDLYQNGDVDFLVATDAIGMGLNLDLDHVAFAGLRKFDGRAHRNLTPAELGQIAGRAGRHMNDGTFGVTGQVAPFEPELVERLENHSFDQVGVLQWRNRTLDFASIERLKDSLRETPDHPRLVRARMVDDVIALGNVSHDTGVRDMARGPAAVRLLWDMCQIPDYRKISAASHAELVATLYRFVIGEEGHIPADWFATQVALADRTDGDLDTLSNRLAQIRTWTFVSNRAEWLADPGHWQGRTRAIEDTLSDALHERLTRRFVDRRTSVLMRRLRDKEEILAEITPDGQILVEDHYVGRLDGFRYTPDTPNDGLHGRAARHAAAKFLGRELAERADALVAASDDAIVLTPNGRFLWAGSEVARLERGESALKPRIYLYADEHLGPARARPRAEAAPSLVRCPSWRPDQAAGRAERSPRSHRPRPRVRLPAGGESRRASPRCHSPRDQGTRSERPRPAPRLWRPLWCLQYLPPGAAQARLCRSAPAALGALCGARSRHRQRHHAGAAATGTHLRRGRPARRRGLLACGGISAGGHTRRAHRHAGEAVGPDPHPIDVALHTRRRGTPARRHGRWQFPRGAGVDVRGRLLG